MDELHAPGTFAWCDEGVLVTFSLVKADATVAAAFRTPSKGRQLVAGGILHVIATPESPILEGEGRTPVVQSRAKPSGPTHRRPRCWVPEVDRLVNS